MHLGGNYSSNLKVLVHICDTYYCNYLTHTTFRFCLIDFQLELILPSSLGLRNPTDHTTSREAARPSCSRSQGFSEMGWWWWLIQSYFQLNTDFPYQFCIFTVKSLSVTQRSVSQENASKKNKNHFVFFPQTLGSNYSFTLNEKKNSGF